MGAAGGKPVFGSLKSGLADLRVSFGLLGGAVWTALAPLLPFIIAAGLVAAALYLMWENSKILRDSVKDLVDAVGGALNDAMTTINDAIKQVMPSFTGVSDIFKKIGDLIGTYIVPIFKIVLVGAITTLAGFISGLIKIVGGIFKAFKDPVEGVQLILSGFVDFFKSFFLTPLTNLLRVADVFGLLPEGLKKAINKMIGMWNNFRLELRIPNNAGTRYFGIANQGFTIDTPDVPYLAKGGIVPATRGGMLSIIGEAGRAERVEPLDSQGLSTRDRAIISQLSGGGTNGASPTINIYPSESMDERALASVVSRNLVWSMRRGA
jgi:hypothetical protein